MSESQCYIGNLGQIEDLRVKDDALDRDGVALPGGDCCLEHWLGHWVIIIDNIIYFKTFFGLLLSTTNKNFFNLRFTIYFYLINSKFYKIINLIISNININIILDLDLDYLVLDKFKLKFAVRLN